MKPIEQNSQEYLVFLFLGPCPWDSVSGSYYIFTPDNVIFSPKPYKNVPNVLRSWSWLCPVDTGRKLNVHKTFRSLMYVQFTSCVYWVLAEIVFQVSNLPLVKNLFLLPMSNSTCKINQISKVLMKVRNR